MSLVLNILFASLFIFINHVSGGRLTNNIAAHIVTVSSGDVSKGRLHRLTMVDEMKFLLLWESMGNFSILAVFERYLSNACTDPHQILFV